MGKTMPKSTVIYGQQHAVRVAAFTGANLAAIVSLVKDKVGPDVKINQSAINAAINQAKNHKKMKDAYVKIGVIDGDLILRCKEKKFFGDIEIDVVLVKGYKPKASKYEIVKLENQMKEIERAKQLQDDLLRRSTRPTPPSKPQNTPSLVKPEVPQVPQPQAPEKPKEPTREERLHKVMNTPGQDGQTMREKLLQAAEKGKKLGVGKGTQERLARQGLHPMDERYHGEVLDHQKNRYGRHLKPLKDVWDGESNVGMNFSQWLDEVEKRNTSVPGVAKALTLRNSDTGGLIVEEGGTAGGTMIYLDDEGRKPYEARASKGNLTGTHVASGEVIFVIGPDNKLYAGKKARAQAGKRGAFNHSSFFSGAPIKSAGTLKVAGGRVTQLSDLSGHYTPTPAMVMTAIRKIGGGDQAWLDEVRILVSNKDVGSGTEFLAGESQKRQTETWTKYSHGPKTTPWAEGVLKNGEDGAWLVRNNRTGQLTVSYRKGDDLKHVLVGELGKLGLERAKLIVPGKLPPERIQPQPPQPKPQAKPQEPTRPQPSTERIVSQLGQRNVEAIRKSPAFHGTMSSTQSNPLLSGKPVGSWLLRESQEGIMCFSEVEATQHLHTRITTDSIYRDILNKMNSRPDLMVKP